MSRNSRSALFVSLCVIVLAGACSAKGDDAGGSTEDGSSTTQANGTAANPAGDTVKFGDLASPCGKGEVKVEPSESGGSTDKLLIGVANDRSSSIRPGLNKEVWDASNAFVKWCNDQGGIGGLPIQVVDLDGKVLEVESAMAKACNGVFMMVGGGQAQDNLQFSGKDGSDFHKCHLADIPAFTASPEKAQSNGQVQPLPHPTSLISTVWLEQFVRLHPDKAAKMVEVWGDLPAMKAIRNESLAVQESVDGVENVGTLSYPATGLMDWTPLAQEVIRTGATSMHFVGPPTYLGSLVKSLREQKWTGTEMAEANLYDPAYVDSAGAENAAGTIIRSAFHPFEEADKWPAVKQYEDIVKENVDGAQTALLGMQSFSAWLLFGTAANDCADSNDGVLTRACILKAAATQDAWTAGGLHVANDPGPEGGIPQSCEMELTVTGDGTFERAFPTIGSKDDDGGGFNCPADAKVIDVPENQGLGKIGPDQPL